MTRASVPAAFPFTRAFVAGYVRNPVNLLLLVVVPLVFVVVAAGQLADAAELLGGAGGPALETSTAAWAAAFLAAIAMYFQVSGARETDRRLVLAGVPAPRLVGARLLAGLTLAAVAVAAAVGALALRAGVEDLWRTVGGTAMAAIIYLAIGAVVGSLVANAVNGTVVILFVAIVDMFLGPTMANADLFVMRLFPTHFVQLWMVDVRSGHSGVMSGGPGDLGWALVWAFGAVMVAWAVVASRARVARRRRGPAPGSVIDQLRMGVRVGLLDYLRNPVQWVLLVLVPVVFVLLSDAITPDRPIVLALAEAGRTVRTRFSLAHVHGATMTPIAIASLAALAGLFVVLNARSGDRRLAQAGFRPGVLLTARLGTVAVTGVVATAASLGMVAVVFDAHDWPVFALGNLLVAAVYGLLGVVLGVVFGQVGGVFIAFVVPFLDLGISQSPMLRDQPPAWARFLPGYGGYHVMLDGAFTSGFDVYAALATGLAWLAGLGVVAAILFTAATRLRTQSS